MLFKLMLAFILVPLADLFLLMVLSRYTTIWFTLGLVVLSGAIGATLAHWQTRRVGGRIRDKLVQNQLPGELLTDGAMILFAAGLLITPGLITDTVGFSLLIPACRRWYRRWVMARLKGYFDVRVTRFTSTYGDDEDVVDGTVVQDPPVGRHDANEPLS